MLNVEWTVSREHMLPHRQAQHNGMCSEVFPRSHDDNWYKLMCICLEHKYDNKFAYTIGYGLHPYTIILTYWRRCLWPAVVLLLESERIKMQ